jgi:predicted transcriptional regulator
LEFIVDDNATASLAPEQDNIALTADIVSAYVSNNHVAPGDLPALIATTHAALTGLGKAEPAAAPAVEKLTPAQVRKSITHDALISFIDGRPYKTLKRHLTGHGLTIETYRERYGLPRDYPSTAAGYSAQRSELAKSLGLGQQRRKAAPKAAAPAETVVEQPKARGRKKTAEAPAKPARARKAKKAPETAAAG